MTDEEAKKMLKAKLECFKNETSGINHDCNMRLCDGCSLNYEQGNMGEQKEALETAIKALEQQPCEDCVSRQAVLDKKELVELEDGQSFYCINPKDVETLPSVTPQRPKGKWIPIHPLQADDDGAYMCSCCEVGDWGIDLKVDKYCFNCGADMRGDNNG